MLKVGGATANYSAKRNNRITIGVFGYSLTSERNLERARYSDNLNLLIGNAMTLQRIYST